MVFKQHTHYLLQQFVCKTARHANLNFELKGIVRRSNVGQG
jgi:hypothetical protein